MSGVTCQFCGKPLWRIRRGSDGDFCSREHRNQYKLRMGFTQIAEAEKVSLVRRKCEVCNSSALAKAVGHPESQRRRPISGVARRGIRPPLFLPVRMPCGPGLRGAAVAPALGARRWESRPAGAAALNFAPRGVRLRPARPLPLDGPRGAGTGGLRLVQVPLRDGGLGMPVFLIARFPVRPLIAPANEARHAPEVRHPGAMPVECHAGAVGRPAARKGAAPFRFVPVHLPITGRLGHLGDIPCVPHGLMPYSALDNTLETRIDPYGHLAPAGPSPAAALTPGLAAMRRAGSFRTREIAPVPLNRRGQRIMPVSGHVFTAPLAAPRIRGVSDLRLRELGFLSLDGKPVISSGSRRLMPPLRNPRRVVRGRRAGWIGRARLPGSVPRLPAGMARNVAAAARPVDLVIHSGAPVVPCLSPLAPEKAVVGARRLGTAVRGSATARPLELTRVVPDVLLVHFQPCLRGLPGDPIPGGGASLAEDHFERGLGLWSGDTQHWKLDIAGVRPAGPALFVPSLGLADYRLEFLARVERGAIACLFRVNGSDCHVIRISGGGAALEHYAFIGGTVSDRVTVALPGVGPGKSFQVQIDVRGDEFAAAVNGLAVGRWRDGRLPSGGVGFGSDPEDRTRLYWVKLSYRTPEDCRVNESYSDGPSGGEGRASGGAASRASGSERDSKQP